MATTFIYNLTDTWNSGSTTFDGIKLNVTDTASAADSKLLNLQVGGSTLFSIDKAGAVVGTGSLSMGSIAATTATAGDNSTAVATTAFVQGEIADFASLASPALTGTPTAPTAAGGTNTTQIATTEFVTSAVAAIDLTLGTNTTGNYVATIAGTANEIEVSGSGSETAAVTLGLPNDVTIGNDLTVTGEVSAEGYTLNNAISPQTGTAYTPALADAERYIQLDNAGAITLTVPSDSTTAFPVGTTVTFEQTGAGTVTFTADAGVTLNSRGAVVATAGQFAVATIVKTAANTFTLTGDLA